MSRPHLPLSRTKGSRDWTRTLYFIFQTLVGLSLITESKYHIQGYKNKTTTVVVFTVSIDAVLSPIYIYIYKNCTFTFTYTYSERGTYYDEPLLVCWPNSMRKIADVLLCTYTDLKPVLSFTLGGKHMTYICTHALIL